MRRSWRENVREDGGRWCWCGLRGNRDDSGLFSFARPRCFCELRMRHFLRYLHWYSPVSPSHLFILALWKDCLMSSEFTESSAYNSAVPHLTEPTMPARNEYSFTVGSSVKD